MLTSAGIQRVYLACGPTDLRKSIDSLAALVQIGGVCNMYENQMEAVPPHEAMEMVMASSGIAYSADVVQAFVRADPSYPPGTKIRLLNGKEAIVTRITSHMQRPVVRVLSTGEEISLADHPTVMIAGCL